ncbi:MAG: beta-hydroxyacyl-ACP dehydratase [Bacteriovoracaceae bacterium]|jgi:3-hydroxymyristoyl/3-hydroxydecanoyl-(acyl carrier protein) dehydratase|nr:beta-hydroxyacyl-ACP dehydratase [Bacteriovoracaceae bacterium]
MIDTKEHFQFAREDIAMEKGLLKVSLSIAADLPYFDGHFPDNPVLPGVAILDATLWVIRSFMDRDEIEYSTIKNAKFMSVVKPGDQIDLTIEIPELEDEWFKCSWCCGGQTVSELRFSISGC